MSIFKNLFELSLKKDIKTRCIFWGIVVVLNASVGFSLAYSMHDYTVLGMLLWILIWTLIYIFLGTNLYRKIWELGYKKPQISLFLGYFFRTVYSFIGIVCIGVGFVLKWWELYMYISPLENFFYSIFIGPDFVIGMVSVFIIDLLWLEWLSGNLTILWNFWPTLYTCLITIIHGWILSILTFIVWIFIYPLVYIYLRKLHTNSENPIH